MAHAPRPATATSALVRRVVAVPLLVGLTALTYHAAVHPAFQVVRVRVVEGEERALPGTADLIGRMATDFPHRPGAVRAVVGAAEAFANVDSTGDTVPLHVRARVFAAGTDVLAVVVNGRIVATARCHQENDATVLSTMIPESGLRPGRNEVAIVQIERAGGTTTLVATLP